MPFIAPIIGAVVGAIGTAAVAIGSFIGSLGIAGQMLIAIGVNVVSVLAARARAKQQQQPGGVQFERQYGGDVPRQVPCGLVGIAGHDCYVNTFGSSNKYLQQVYTVSDYYTDGLSRVAINGKWVTLGTVADPEKGFPVSSGDFRNLIWIKFVNGRQTVADNYLKSRAYPTQRWTENHIGVGVSFILVSMTFDEENNNSFPDFFFEFRGAPLYDWRKDSSVGGSGPQRWDDPTTHVYSENPIVMEYNYRRGFSVNGDLFCGMGMPASDLPLDKWTAAANICDETTSGGHIRYRCSIILDCMATHKQNIESISLSCGSMVVDGVSGTWPIVGSDQPIVATFDDDALISNADVKFRAKRSMVELVNSVAGNFPDPEQLWSMIGYDPQISDTALAVDRRTRDINIDFPQVRFAAQAAQLASIYLKENRYEATAVITLKPRFQGLEAGDWVRWNSARYGNRVYLVTSTQLVSLDGEGPRNVRVTLQERDGSIYDGVTPPQIIIPYPPGEPQYLEEVQDFTVVKVTVVGDNGKLYPAIRAGWSAIDDATVVGVIIEYWPTSQPDKVFTTPVIARNVTVKILTDGIVSDTQYQVRTKLVTDPLRSVVWGSVYTVTTDAVDADFFPVKLSDLAKDSADYLQWTGEGSREFLDQLLQQIAAKANNDLLAYHTSSSIRREISATYQNAKASWSEDILTAVGPGSAIAARIEALEVYVDDTVATAIDSLTTQIDIVDGRVSANASAITALNSTVGDIASSVTVRGTALASPGGGWARWGVEVKTGAGNAWSTSAFYLDVNGAQSRAVFLTGQFIISDGTATASPFVFSGGVAYMENARIGDVYFKRMRSFNGKLDIRGDAGYSSIEIFT